jgi:superfamily II DNA or RNA helicase
MSRRDDQQEKQKDVLHPYQADFVADFLAPSSEEYHHLIAPIGMGRTATTLAIVQDLVERGKARRILILVDRVLIREAFTQQLRRSRKWDLPIRTVDERVYRELEASVEVGVSPFQRPMVTIMTVRTAAKDSIMSSVVAIMWDLVIVDGMSGYSSSQRELVVQLLKTNTAKRALLISSGFDDKSTSILPDNMSVKVTQWSSDETDWFGNRVLPKQRRVILSYERSLAERKLLAQLRETYYGLVNSQILMRLASSSLYALEQSLRRQRNRLTHGVPSTVFQSQSQDSLDAYAEIDNASTSPEERRARSPGLLEIKRLLHELDEITTDSKLQALLNTLQSLGVCASNKVCIFSSYASTVYYLHASFTDLIRSVFQVSGSTSSEEVYRTTERFSRTGGVIIVSDAVLLGLDLGDVSIGISYDLPANRLMMERRWARLMRSRASKTVTMYAFQDQSRSSYVELEALEQHGFLDSEELQEEK